MLHVTVRTPARLLLPLAILVFAAPLAGQETQPQAQQQREHLVKRGDTLWDLARFYLGNPFLWPSIFDANRNVVENAHWIYPRERLIIPPVLQRQPVTEPVSQPVVTIVEPTRQETQLEPTQRQEPAAAPVVTTLDLRRPVVPLTEWLAVPWVSATADREVVGRVVETVDPEATTDKLAPMLHPTDRVFVGQVAGSVDVGDSLVVVRFGRRVGDRGRIVEPVAILLVDSTSSTLLTARIARQLSDARIGDLVLPLGAVPEIGLGEPAAVSNGVEGQLLQFHLEEPLHSTTDLAFVSLGRRDGLGIGDELAVYVPERSVGSDRLPPTSIATVRVVKVGDNVATVRVLGVNSTALRDGLPVRLIRKMP